MKIRSLVLFTVFFAFSSTAFAQSHFEKVAQMFNEAGPASLSDFLLDASLVGKSVYAPSPAAISDAKLFTLGAGDEIVGYKYYSNLYGAHYDDSTLKSETEYFVRRGEFIKELQVSEDGTEVVQLRQYLNSNCQLRYSFRKHSHDSGKTLLIAKYAYSSACTHVRQIDGVYGYSYFVLAE